MSDDDANTSEAPTRREYVKYGGAVVGGGLLAGCTSDPGSERTPTPSETDTDAATPTRNVTEDDSYSVRIAPMGDVEFDEVPQDVFTVLGHHVDMLLARGHGDDIDAMHGPGYHQALYEKLVARLDGVSVDWEGLCSSWPPTKEKLYELDSDVHIADPAKLTTGEGWDDGDVREIAENAHQAAVCAGHGAEVGVTILEDDDRPFYHDWVAPDGYFTDRGRELPPGCKEIGESERTDRESQSLDVMAERFAEPHPDEQETHPSLGEE